MTRTIVGRHINDISLNPLEYLLDGNGDEMLFDSKACACAYLLKIGFTEDDIEWMHFQEIEIETAPV